MKKVVVVLFLLMLVLLQDTWFWGSDSMVFGFLPVGLAYHALFSIGCAVLGVLAIRFAWPRDDEEGGE